MTKLLTGVELDGMLDDCDMGNGVTHGQYCKELISLGERKLEKLDDVELDNLITNIKAESLLKVEEDLSQKELDELLNGTMTTEAIKDDDKKVMGGIPFEYPTIAAKSLLSLMGVTDENEPCNSDGRLTKAEIEKIIDVWEKRKDNLINKYCNSNNKEQNEVLSQAEIDELLPPVKERNGVLSQVEIDSVLTSIATGEVKADDFSAPRNIRCIKLYDFKHPDIMTRRDMSQLSDMYEKITPYLISEVFRKLDKKAHINIVSITQLTGIDLMRSINTEKDAILTNHFGIAFTGNFDYYGVLEPLLASVDYKIPNLLNYSNIEYYTLFSSWGGQDTKVCITFEAKFQDEVDTLLCLAFPAKDIKKFLQNTDTILRGD